jgi:hypothetical protein
MSICSKDRKYQDLSMCCKSLENEKNMVKEIQSVGLLKKHNGAMVERSHDCIG